MQLNELTQQDLAIITRLFGALYYFSPADYEQASLSMYLDQDVETPVTIVNQVLDEFKFYNRDELTQLYHNLFSGMVAPWGSMYLDPGMKTSGDSTEAYHDFIAHCGLEAVKDDEQPQDHIGLMLMVLGLLIEDEQTQHVKEMLGEYLLTWFGFFSEQLKLNASNTPYNALLNATTDLLILLRDKHEVEVLDKENHFTAILARSDLSALTRD